MPDPTRRAATHLARRRFLRLLGAATTALAAGGVRPVVAADKTGGGRDPEQVLAGLLDGNRRFASGRAESPRRRPQDFAALAAGQSPIACIVGCSDSRVTPDLVFDQGVGDLFVVRIAGNVVASPGYKVTGSIEYAVAELGVTLVMVLGHTSCGALKAAIAHADKRDALPGAIRELVNALRPAVQRAKGKPGDPLDNAIRANVEMGVDRLRKLGPVLRTAVAEKRLKVVGGLYDLASGSVAVIA